MSTEIVELNIGGTLFSTTKNILTNTIDINYFYSVFSEHWETKLDKDNRIFIDRNGELFRPILDYLRTGVLYISESIPRHLVFHEAEFYNIDLINIGVEQGLLNLYELNKINEYQTASKYMVNFSFNCLQIPRLENNHRIYDIDFDSALKYISKNPKYFIVENSLNSFTCCPLHHYKIEYSKTDKCYLHYI